MISRIPALVSAALMALASPALAAGDGSFLAPDSVVLKDGRTIRGLIVKNTVDAVVMQEEFGEFRYPKSEIVRIRDGTDIGVQFTDVHEHGMLPPWRVIANDLRTHDTIRSLVEIPAVAVDVGEFRFVPYKSFRVNQNIELNIYGDPERPAGLEIGIFGSRQNDDELRRALRAYLAGYLTSRKEIKALYSVPLDGGVAPAGELTVSITPKDAPDAFGAWWIAVYNPQRIEEIRLTPSEYARLTKPADEVIDRRGRVLDREWAGGDLAKSERVDDVEGDRVIRRGFYRDKDGVFRLIGTPAL